MSDDLFRPEVLDSHAKRAYGDVLLLHPISHFVLAAIGFALFVGLIVTLAFCHYTRHTRIAGVIEPEGGVVKLYANKGGRLRSSRVREGATVHKGDVLLLFASEHEGTTGIAVEEKTEEWARERIDTLRIESESMLSLSKSELAGANETLSALRGVRSNVLAQIEGQIKRVKSAQGVLARFVALEKSGFMPEVQIQAKRDDLTDQQVRLQSMQRDLVSNSSDIAKVQREIASAPLRELQTQAQARRSIVTAQAELDSQLNDHEWSVTAPCDGVVGALGVSLGQTVGTNTPLLTLVPKGTLLMATLYAPSRSLGFLRGGQTTNMEIEAFPYQKFGFVTGKVTMIAASPVFQNEISPSARLIGGSETVEPLYAINIALDRQFIDAYGKRQALRPGMQLSANVELDTRLLYEWVLEPLASLQRQ